jgi:hypothetical protein
MGRKLAEIEVLGTSVLDRHLKSRVVGRHEEILGGNLRTFRRSLDFRNSLRLRTIRIQNWRFSEFLSPRVFLPRQILAPSRLIRAPPLLEPLSSLPSFLSLFLFLSFERILNTA